MARLKCGATLKFSLLSRGIGRGNDLFKFVAHDPGQDFGAADSEQKLLENDEAGERKRSTDAYAMFRVSRNAIPGLIKILHTAYKYKGRYRSRGMR